MLNFFKLIFGDSVLKINSFVIKVILVLKGIKVGKNFYISGVPKLKIKSKLPNITIGDNVKILGNIDLRTRENGKIFFKNDTLIEEDCRFVSARDGVIEIGQGTKVCADCIINGGEDIIIGKNCIIGKNTSINSNSHSMLKKETILNQGFDLKPVIIGDDCWTGINSVITYGVTLKKGTVIGANSLINKDTEEYSINVGLPAKKIRNRE
tara:strand:- start:3514 stop:4140 length:627 start_codon:yes stop_codon:yes gene_type:complete